MMQRKNLWIMCVKIILMIFFSMNWERIKYFVKSKQVWRIRREFSLFESAKYVIHSSCLYSKMSKVKDTLKHQSINRKMLLKFSTRGHGWDWENSFFLTLREFLHHIQSISKNVLQWFCLLKIRVGSFHLNSWRRVYLFSWAVGIFHE